MRINKRNRKISGRAKKGKKFCERDFRFQEQKKFATKNCRPRKKNSKIPKNAKREFLKIANSDFAGKNLEIQNFTRKAKLINFGTQNRELKFFGRGFATRNA